MPASWTWSLICSGNRNCNASQHLQAYCQLPGHVCTEWHFAQRCGQLNASYWNQQRIHMSRGSCVAADAWWVENHHMTVAVWLYEQKEFHQHQPWWPSLHLQFQLWEVLDPLLCAEDLHSQKDLPSVEGFVQQRRGGWVCPWGTRSAECYFWR